MSEANTQHGGLEDSSIQRSLIVLITLFFTGFAGLVYQVVWHRYLANQLGSEARATAMVLALFLGGLATGYRYFGLRTRGKSPRALVTLCGVLEIAIGLYALFFPNFFHAVQYVDGLLPAVSGPLGFAIDLLTSALLIGFPTFLMGGTLPLLTQGLSESLKQSPRVHAWIYTSNTAGAFLGCLGAGLILIPAFGLPIAMMATSLLNLIGGLVLAMVGASLEDTVPQTLRDSRQPTPGESKTSWRLSFLRAGFLAFMSGFISITLQTVFIRLGGISFGSSEYTFSMVVSIFILTLAIGSFFVTLRPKQSMLGNQLILSFGLILVAVSAPYWPWLAHILRIGFSQASVAFYFYFTAVFFALLLIILPIGFALGRNMPLLFESITSKLEEVGDDVGRLYFINTIGCVIGGLIGGYLLLNLVNIDRLLQICLAISIVGAIVLVPLQWLHQRAAATWTIAVVLSGVAFLLPTWNKKFLAFGTFRWIHETPRSYEGPEALQNTVLPPFDLLAYQDDPNTSVAVIEHGVGRPVDGVSAQRERSILVNGKSDSSTVGDLPTTILSGQIPALLKSGEIGDVAVVGYGTGVTVGSLAGLEEVKSVDVLEISQGVKNFASFFDDANGNASDHPKVTWIMGDAYKHLIRTPKRYGLIISEPSNPWVIGVERLFTSDFLKAVSQRLTSDGIYAQFFHTYESTERTIALVLSSYNKVFPHIRVFYGLKDDLIIVGSFQKLGREHVDNLERRFKSTYMQQQLARAGVHTIAGVLMREYPIPEEFYKDRGEHSLEFPKLAHFAGRDFFYGRTVSLFDLLDSDRYRALSRRQDDSSLMAQWYGMQPDKKATLVQIGESFCGPQVRDPQVFATEQANLRCRRVLGALVANQESIWPAIKEWPKDIALLADVKANKDIVPHDLTKSGNRLRVIATLSSPYLRFKGDQLMRVAADCLTTDQAPAGYCLGQLIENLVIARDLDLAAQPLAKLRDLPKVDPFYLRFLETLLELTKGEHKVVDAGG